MHERVGTMDILSPLYSVLNFRFVRIGSGSTQHIWRACIYFHF